MSEAKPNLVFFGVECSDFEKDSNMLQIFMKSGASSFNGYIDPIKPISTEMTRINHLTVRFLKLYRDNVYKLSRPLRKVMELLLEYLKQFDGPCVLIGHKHCFSDAFHLIRAIKQLSMEKEFASVIDGFTNIFQLYLEKFPKKKGKDLMLRKLAAEAGLSWTHPVKSGRSIKHNTILLEKLALNTFSIDELKVQKTFIQHVRHFEKSPQGSLMVRAKFTDTVPAPLVPTTAAGPQTKRRRKLKRTLQLKENAEVKSSKKTKRIQRDNPDTTHGRKRSKVVSTEPEMLDYCVPMRTRTRINLNDNPILD